MLQHHEQQLHSSRSSLFLHLSAALPIRHNQQSQPLVTPEAHSALCHSAQLVSRLAQEAQSADQKHGCSRALPAWKQALAALQEAAAHSSGLCHVPEGTVQGSMEAALGQQQRASDGADAGVQSVQQELSQQWQAQIEDLVKNVLLWAQGIKGKEGEESAETGTANNSCSSAGVKLCLV